jgi:mercuric ion binding protein
MFAIFAAASTAALAELKTVTLAVSGMTCATCPIAVRKALTRVEGVSKATASLEKSEAQVTFDDARTNVGALMKASADAGYPSTLKNSVAAK